MVEWNQVSTSNLLAVMIPLSYIYELSEQRKVYELFAIAENKHLVNKLDYATIKRRNSNRKDIDFHGDLFW